MPVVGSGEMYDYEDRTYDPEAVYDKEYFEGDGLKSGYTDYHDTTGVLQQLVRITYVALRDRFPWILEAPTTIDVGGAYGHVSQLWVRNKFDHAINIEISPWAAAQSKKLYPEVEVILGDVTTSKPWTKLKGQRADLITAYEFFEHIPTKKIDYVLGKMQKHGRLGVFLLQSASSPHEDADGAKGDHGHLHYHSKLWWLNKFAEYGDIYFDAMAEMDAAAFGLDGLSWASRLYVVEFRKASR